MKKSGYNFDMEKQNPSPTPCISRHSNTIIINGVMKVPPGFRFKPTDEELVLQYLRRKAFSYPLHSSFIPEIDLSKHNPWDLPDGGCEEERYFFVLRETKIATESGYWKATGKDRVVVATKCGRAVGLKKTLVFYKGKAPRGQKTDWVMHEYSLAISNIFSQRKSLSLHGAVGIKDWVLCRIFMKKRSGISYVRGLPSPAHSDSSCVTNHAVGKSNDGEEISSLLQ